MPNGYEERKTASSGRGTFTTKDYKAGGLVFQDRTPFLAVLNSSLLTYACSWCYIVTEENEPAVRQTVSACAGCKVVFYCGKACQTLSWKYSHKYECKMFKSLYPNILPNTARMMVQLLQRHKNNVIPKEDWDSFLKLHHHMDDLKNGARDKNPHHRQNLEDVQLMARTAAKYSGSSQDISNAELIARRILINSLTLISPIFTPLGLVLSLPGSLLNHSCNPNCATTFNGRSMELRVLEPTQSNTELTISYTHTTISAELRRQDTQNRYHFICKCSQCIGGLTLNHPDIDPKVQLLTSDAVREDFQKEVSSFMIKARDQPATEALGTISEAYQLCRKHADYPPWRSPLLQLRLDFVMVLNAKKLRVAGFIQSTILHFKTDPIIYSQRSHPARVAHTYVYSRITAYIAGIAKGSGFAALVGESDEGELADSLGEEFGFEWGLIVYALVKEASDHVLQSHGLESRFSLEVGRQMSSIRQQAAIHHGEPSKKDLERAKAKLVDVANRGWDWWIQQMRARQRTRVLGSSDSRAKDGLSILLR